MTGTAGSLFTAGDGGESGDGGGSGSPPGNAGESGGGHGGDAGENGGGGVAPGGSSGTGGSGAGTGGGSAAGSAGTGGSSAVCVEGERQICSVTSGTRGGCFETMRFCVNEEWSECKAIPGEMIPGGGEACNREDDDCDGLIDEGLGDISCGLGVCRRTVAACTRGSIGACLPGVPSTDFDGCNGQDDDCDGAVDEDCSACVKVAPAGDDTAAVASRGETPFATVQAAIDFADTHRSISTRVCVAAGPTCGSSATFPGPASADLTMRSGIDVLGKYESTTFTRCVNSTTTLAPQTSLGVVFPASLAAPTRLDGFTISRVVAATSAGVTASAAGVVLSNLRIDDGPAATNSYGVNVIGGDTTVVRSRITGGVGTGQAIGVRAFGARVTLDNNCESLDPTTGRCDDPANGPLVPLQCLGGLQISGHHGDSAGTNNAVKLENAPGSRIEGNTLCAVGGHTERPAGALVALRIGGDAENVVIRGNSVVASSAGYQARAMAIAMDGCSGKSPLIVNNYRILAVNVPADSLRASRGADIEAIHSFGDCHPVIDHNPEVVAIANTNFDGQDAWGWGIRVGELSGMASRTIIEGSEVTGSGNNTTGMVLRLKAVACEAGACAKVSRNVIFGRRSHPLNPGMCRTPYCRHAVTGLELSGGSQFVDSNFIAGGCGNTADALFVNDSGARIQNNRLAGPHREACGSSEPIEPEGYKLRLTLVSGSNEVDFHSNLVAGLRESLITGPAVPIGIFRNNGILDVSGRDPVCQIPTPFRLFENNLCAYDVDDLYFPQHTKDRGTSAGAPLWDRDGKLREPLFDIGPWDY